LRERCHTESQLHVLQALLICDQVPSPDLIIASTNNVKSALLDAGATDVTRASSVDAALSQLAKLQPELVVIDLVDPLSYDGYRRLISRLRGVPVIAIVDEPQLQAAFDAGIDDCVSRPVRRTELVARACAAIRERIARVRSSRRERRLTDEVRALQREKHDLERIVCVDSLTGVANRRHALSLYEAEWKRSAREGTSLSVIMLDIDHFHAFNETYGHPGGDACLRRVSAEIAMCLRRPSDFLGRYGGEEFIAVLANTDAAGAKLVADRLRAAVEGLQIPHAGSSCSEFVTISVGFATMRAEPDQPSELLIHAADRALLTAKATGRNRALGDAPAETRPRLASGPWRRFPVVVVDPWFASRIPPFLETCRTEIVTARDAAGVRNFERIRAISRRLKSSAVEHSIETVAQLAGLLEQAARGDNLDSVGRVLDELAAYIDHVQVTYRRPLERKLHAG
jgi:two-component system chemotaxis family response regulator WspR